MDGKIVGVALIRVTLRKPETVAEAEEVSKPTLGEIEEAIKADIEALGFEVGLDSEWT